jgi:hypothetical protein
MNNRYRSWQDRSSTCKAPHRVAEDAGHLKSAPGRRTSLTRSNPISQTLGSRPGFFEFRGTTYIRNNNSSYYEKTANVAPMATTHTTRFKTLELPWY